MKTINMIGLVGVMVVMSAAIGAQADQESRHEVFQKALAACVSSPYNTAQVTFPQPVPGQRPQWTADQKALFMACREAGIIPEFRHHRHEQQALQNGAPQDARQPSSN